MVTQTESVTSIQPISVEEAVEQAHLPDDQKKYYKYDATKQGRSLQLAKILQAQDNEGKEPTFSIQVMPIRGSSRRKRTIEGASRTVLFSCP